MHSELARRFVDSVRKRVSQGDCPTEPALSVENLEDLVLTLADAKQDDAHPDDHAVDRFATAMKAKLAEKRQEGRGGWEDKTACTAEFLSELLRGHVDKGGPLDVGNFAMMLHQRGERITPKQDDARDSTVGAEPVAWLHPEAGWANNDREFVALHCRKDGPQPVPLYTAAALASARADGVREGLEQAAKVLDARADTAITRRLERHIANDAAAIRALIPIRPG